MKKQSEFELPLSLIQGEIAASDLLTDAYKQYRPLLADGLRFFLERLPAPRLRQLLAEQARLPALTPTASRLVALLRHCPALHKLGQIVARDHRLERPFRQRLQELESLPPARSIGAAAKVLDAEVKGWRKAGIQLGAEPLAEGSVAWVVPFTWQAHPRQPPQPGVFKMLKPGIERRLEEDLEIIGQLGAFLDQDCARYHLPELDYHGTFETIRTLLHHEVRLEKEQAHLAEAARTYASQAAVLVPALFPFCSNHVTAMQRLTGKKVAANGWHGSGLQRSLARLIGEALVAEPLFSQEPEALFHADPHAGNLLATPDGRLGILDWSLAGRLSKDDRVAVAQLLLGAFALDVPRMRQTVERLALKPTSPSRVEAVLKTALRELRWGAFPGIGWLTTLLDNLMAQAGLRFNGQLVLFRKSLLTLEGVLADLAPLGEMLSHSMLDATVVASFSRHWTVEWAYRFAAPFHARPFNTHLSNSDLLWLLCSGSVTATRWWSETSLDLLRALQGPKTRRH